MLFDILLWQLLDDGKTGVTAGYDPVVHMWAIPDAPNADSALLQLSHIRELQGHTGPVYGLSYDSAVIGTCSRDSTVRVWSRHTGVRLVCLS